MNFAKTQDVEKKFSFSQEQLADKIGVSRQAITKWETEGASHNTENANIVRNIVLRIVN
ncbi:MAG: helix-turn-helix domain-containing protein [Clostridiales bacterium]|nr:helix-turn-helix domain-containing protein [Clostridiales bacterium]